MPLIEGIGDEVTFIFAALFVIIIVVCAWLSTHTRDIPFFSLLIVELSRRRNRTPEPPVATNSTEGHVTAQPPSSDSNEGGRTEPLTGGENDSRIGEDRREPVEISGQGEANLGEITTPEAPRPADSSANSEAVSVNPDQTGLDTAVDPESVRKKRLEFLSKPKDSTACDSPGEVGLESSSEAGNDRHGSNSRSSTTAAVNSPQNSINEVIEPTVVEEIDLNDGNIRVKLKYLNDTQRLVQTSPQETIGGFKRTHFGPELAANKLVRLIFNGQCLQNDTSTLQSYNIRDNCTVHCLVTEAQQHSSPPPTDSRSDLDIGVFMFPLFAVFLAIVWYFRFAYRQYFNAMSTFSLVGITFLFSVAMFSAWRSRYGRDEHQHLD